MESRWLSGGARSVVHSIPAHYLAASTNIFSESFICQLGHNLQSNNEQLAKELGFSVTRSATDGLYNWCNNPGSTVFVLVSVLGGLCRTDCVQMIEQYIQSQTMQLFVEVDEAATDGQPGTGAPKFHQIITCCEFSLLQALENILGSDLVYYEIVGPGAWVTWTTQAKELKGQQLTLRCHRQPVSATRAAMCDPMEQETELKQLEMTDNIPGSPASESSHQTHLKVLECTQIENLKFSHEPSVQESNSNNLTDSLNTEKGSPRSLSVEGPTNTFSPLTVDSKNYQFSSDGQTHVKTLVVDRQNTPSLQVIKYFPDKRLYEEIPSKRNDQCAEANQAHPQQVLDNVPRLSLLEGDFPSLSPADQIPVAQLVPAVQQRPIPQPVQAVQQSKFNDLSCGAPSMGKQCMNLQTIPKSFMHENVRSFNVSGQTGKLGLVEGSCNIPADHDLSTKIPIFSELNVSELCMSRAASSLFAQEQQGHIFDVPVSCVGNEYLPHTCVKTPGHFESYGGSVEDHTPVPCGNCGLVTVATQSQHKLGETSLTSTQQQLDHHHQVQHQQLLDVTEMKSKHLWLQKLHRQQALALPQIFTFSEDLESLSDGDSLNVLPHEIFHQDSEVSQSPQQHRPELGQTSYNQTQNSQGMDHQSVHLSEISQEDGDQTQNPLYSHQEVQASTSPFLKPNASRYLICHTPPPGFPDEHMHDDHPQKSESQGTHILPQSGNTFLATDEFNESGQFLDKLSQMTNMDAGSEQYIAMFQPVVHGVGNSSPKLSSVRCQSSLADPSTLQNMDLSSADPSTLQNMDLSSNIVTAQNPSQSPRNQIKSVVSSDSSGGSSECPVFIYSQPFTVFTEGQSSFRTPKPFHPAPLVLDALGRQINASMPNNHNMFRSSFGASGQTHQDGCFPVSRGHLTRSRSLPISRFQTTSLVQTRSLDAQPHVENLELELLSVEGWNPHVNGDTIQETMDRFKSPDGNYIIWKSRRHQKFVISVSYLNQLFHFRVEEVTSQNNGRTVYFLFEGGYSSESFLDLLHHYQQNGIRISMQSAAKQKMYIENIHLLCPLRVTTQMVRKGTSRSK